MKRNRIPLIKPSPSNDDIVETINDILTAQCPLTQIVNGVIIDIELPANKATTFSHSLGTIPLYRFILKQQGNAIFSDGEFTDKKVTFVNHSATNSLKLSIFLLGG